MAIEASVNGVTVKLLTREDIGNLRHTNPNIIDLPVVRAFIPNKDGKVKMPFWFATDLTGRWVDGFTADLLVQEMYRQTKLIYPDLTEELISKKIKQALYVGVKSSVPVRALEGFKKGRPWLWYQFRLNFFFSKEEPSQAMLLLKARQDDGLWRRVICNDGTSTFVMVSFNGINIGSPDNFYSDEAIFEILKTLLEGMPFYTPGSAIAFEKCDFN